MERARYRVCDLVLSRERPEVLLGHVSRRLDFWDFITRMDVSGRLDGKYEKDVADELRHWYSDHPRR
jgi:hypothetical protein